MGAGAGVLTLVFLRVENKNMKFDGKHFMGLDVKWGDFHSTQTLNQRIWAQSLIFDFMSMFEMLDFKYQINLGTRMLVASWIGASSLANQIFIRSWNVFYLAEVWNCNWLNI